MLNYILLLITLCLGTLSDYIKDENYSFLPCTLIYSFNTANDIAFELSHLIMQIYMCKRCCKQLSWINLKVCLTLCDKSKKTEYNIRHMCYKVEEMKRERIIFYAFISRRQNETWRKMFSDRRCHSHNIM
jgi:hypothetical protein